MVGDHTKFLLCSLTLLHIKPFLFLSNIKVCNYICLQTIFIKIREEFHRNPCHHYGSPARVYLPSSCNRAARGSAKSRPVQGYPTLLLEVRLIWKHRIQRLPPPPRPCHSTRALSFSLLICSDSSLYSLFLDVVRILCISCQLFKSTLYCCFSTHSILSYQNHAPTSAGNFKSYVCYTHQEFPVSSVCRMTLGERV